jgi:hypothetical protein
MVSFAAIIFSELTRPCFAQGKFKPPIGANASAAAKQTARAVGRNIVPIPKFFSS